MFSNLNARMADKVKAGIRASKYLDENSRYEILELLGQLEGELQAKDIAIATLKSECLKHILYNLREDRNSLSDPIFALGRDSSKVESTSGNRGSEPDSVHQHVAHRLKVLQTLVDAQKAALKKLTHCLREAEVQKANLIKDLDEERRKREHDTAQGDDITYCLEKDRTNLKQELETEAAEKTRLQSEVETLTQKLKDEQLTKKQIILTLVEDRKKMAALYLEEKKRSEDLNRLLREERAKVNSLGIGLEEESKRSLAMEEELERSLHQVGAHKEEVASLRITQKELEDALRRARQEADHAKKQLAEAHRVAMSQATTTAAAVAAANTQQQQQQQQAFITDPMNDPYPKWNPNQMNSIPSVSDSYQTKSSVSSLFDQDPGLNNNRSISSNSTISRGLVSGVTLPGVGSTILGMPGSAETTRLKTGAHAHPKVVHHVIGGKKVVGSMGAGGNIKVGVPPPIPPNKPAMSALYKPLSAALKVDTGVVGAVSSAAGTIADLSSKK